MHVSSFFLHVFSALSDYYTLNGIIVRRFGYRWMLSRGARLQGAAQALATPTRGASQSYSARAYKLPRVQAPINRRHQQPLPLALALQVNSTCSSRQRRFSVLPPAMRHRID